MNNTVGQLLKCWHYFTITHEPSKSKNIDSLLDFRIEIINILRKYLCGKSLFKLLILFFRTPLDFVNFRIIFWKSLIKNNHFLNINTKTITNHEDWLSNFFGATRGRLISSFVFFLLKNQEFLISDLNSHALNGIE